MKKILAIAVIAISFAACNNDSATTETKDTTTVVTPQAPDTTQVVKTTEVTTDTTHKEGKDTTNKK
jgi:PBP1b-binding outer membrane lipoprotein LpoB